MDDLHHLLGRGQGPHHLFAHRPLPDAVDEDLGHLVVDVGLQQGQAHLAQGLAHLGLAELAVAFQAFEDLGQFVGESVKHLNTVFRFWFFVFG